MTPKMIELAVVTGGHWFEVRGFHQLFRSLPHINATIQHMEDFGSSLPSERLTYQVVLFYNMQMPTPQDSPNPAAREKPLTALEQLPLSGQGIILLHHALMAYPRYPLWDMLVGMSGRDQFTYDHDQHFTIEIKDADHPISRGLAAWQIEDETYVLPEPGEGSQVLFSTNHPRSMRALGWVRLVQRARVFNFQPGHDRRAWQNPTFRTVLSRAVHWCAGED